MKRLDTGYGTLALDKPAPGPPLASYAAPNGG
jgi:hypothetical protein